MFYLIAVLTWLSFGVLSYSISHLAGGGRNLQSHEQVYIALLLGPVGVAVWGVLFLGYLWRQVSGVILGKGESQ